MVIKTVLTFFAMCAVALAVIGGVVMCGMALV